MSARAHPGPVANRDAREMEAAVVRHRPLALSLARRYRSGAYALEDLEQAACVGLVKAVRRFDPARECSFTTYAVPTILGELRRFCRDTGWSAHVPRGLRDRAREARRTGDELYATTGRVPTVAELAGRLGWPEEQVAEALTAASSRTAFSLDAGADDDPDGPSVLDRLGAVDPGFELVECLTAIESSLPALGGTEKEVLRLRFDGDLTVREIARRLDLPEGRVSRLLASALATLRSLVHGAARAEPGPPPVRALTATPATAVPSGGGDGMSGGFFERALGGGERPVQLWQHDPELFAALDPAAGREARQRVVAPGLRLDPGPWSGEFAADGDPAAHLGLLVVEGLLLRTVTIAHHSRSELIGPGDLIRPWDAAHDFATTPSVARWDVVESARLAVLGPAFLASACQWPPLISALTGRAVRRARRLGLQLAITDVRRVDERLLMLFEHFADRWGLVRSDGILVPLRVTHEVLAQLAGAQRPTVTSALQRLRDEGRIRRLADRTWLLPGAPAGDASASAGRPAMPASRDAA